MSVYLTTVKINQNGRITLCPSALRNLGVKIGDALDIHYDEEDRCLLVKTVEPDQPDTVDTPPRKRKSK